MKNNPEINTKAPSHEGTKKPYLNQATAAVVKKVWQEMDACSRLEQDEQYDLWSGFLVELMSEQLCLIGVSVTHDEGRWLMTTERNGKMRSETLTAFQQLAAVIETWNKIYPSTETQFSPRAGNPSSRSTPRTDGARRSPQTNVIAGRGSRNNPRPVSSQEIRRWE